MARTIEGVFEYGVEDRLQVESGTADHFPALHWWPSAVERLGEFDFGPGVP
jgi:hypothetical protein